MCQPYIGQTRNRVSTAGMPAANHAPLHPSEARCAAGLRFAGIRLAWLRPPKAPAGARVIGRRASRTASRRRAGAAARPPPPQARNPAVPALGLISLIS